MSLRKVIDWAIAEANGEMQGTIASGFYKYYDSNGQWSYACDVDIGSSTGEPLRNVVVATNNHDILYAQIGMPVSLTRQVGNVYAITGLSKTVQDKTHIIYMTFTDAYGTIVRKDTTKKTYRDLTYGEIGDIFGGGYGDLPYGSKGVFDADGNLIEIIRSF